jgi:hypothetical protein
MWYVYFDETSHYKKGPCMIILHDILEKLKSQCNYSAKKVKRSKKRLDRVFWGKAKMHLCPSVLSILA